MTEYIYSMAIVFVLVVYCCETVLLRIDYVSP